MVIKFIIIIHINVLKTDHHDVIIILIDVIVPIIKNHKNVEQYNKIEDAHGEHLINITLILIIMMNVIKVIILF